VLRVDALEPLDVLQRRVADWLREPRPPSAPATVPR
jgi:hypothetical protein